MLKECTIGAMLPDHEEDLAAAVKTYQSFGTRRGAYADLEKEHGVVALDIMPLYDHLHMTLPASVPASPIIMDVIPAVSSDYESDVSSDSSEF